MTTTPMAHHDQAPQFLLVIDLEATCDEAGRLPRREMEVIEIGGVLVGYDTLESLGEFQTFVRPRRHLRLTPFCTRLTTITQSQVDSAPSFAEAVEALRVFLDGRRPTFCSWGDYDREQLAQDAAFAGVSLPFSLTQHINLKARFAEALGETKKRGTHGALARVGLGFEGVRHRGIDDARNITRLLPWALGRVATRDVLVAGSSVARPATRGR